MKLSDLVNPNFRISEPFESAEVAEQKRIVAAKQTAIDELVQTCAEMLKALREKDERIEDLCILCDSVGSAALLARLNDETI